MTYLEKVAQTAEKNMNYTPVGWNILHMSIKFVWLNSGAPLLIFFCLLELLIDENGV
jgi:hypothetical protein